MLHIGDICEQSVPSHEGEGLFQIRQNRFQNLTKQKADG
jgi:hypothetical protein